MGSGEKSLVRIVGTQADGQLLMGWAYCPKVVVLPCSLAPNALVRGVGLSGKIDDS